MAGKKQTKALFQVPKSSSIIEHTVLTQQTDLNEVKRYCNFIKHTTGYEPSVSDVFNQGVLFFIRRDTVYKNHRERQDDVIVKKVKKASVPPIEPALFVNAERDVSDGNKAEA